jgi:hypothetical protein
LLGNAEVFQEIDVPWQLLRFSCSVRGELVWNPSKMKAMIPISANPAQKDLRG